MTPSRRMSPATARPVPSPRAPSCRSTSTSHTRRAAARPALMNPVEAEPVCSAPRKAANRPRKATAAPGEMSPWCSSISACPAAGSIMTTKISAGVKRALSLCCRVAVSRWASAVSSTRLIDAADAPVRIWVCMEPRVSATVLLSAPLSSRSSADTPLSRRVCAAIAHQKSTQKINGVSSSCGLIRAMRIRGTSAPSTTSTRRSPPGDTSSPTSMESPICRAVSSPGENALRPRPRLRIPRKSASRVSRATAVDSVSAMMTCRIPRHPETAMRASRSSTMRVSGMEVSDPTAMFTADPVSHGTPAAATCPSTATTAYAASRPQRDSRQGQTHPRNHWSAPGRCVVLTVRFPPRRPPSCAVVRPLHRRAPCADDAADVSELCPPVAPRGADLTPRRSPKLLFTRTD